ETYEGLLWNYIAPQDSNIPKRGRRVTTGFGAFLQSSQSSPFGGSDQTTTTQSIFPTHPNNVFGGFGCFGQQATQPTTQPAGFGFDHTTLPAHPSGFGQQATQPATHPAGFGFGQTTQPTQPTGFGQQATQPATQPAGFGFGQTTQPSGSGFGFTQRRGF